MKKIFKMVIGVLAVVLMAGQVFSAEQLSPPEIRQIESELRSVFQLQQSYVNSSLISVGNDLDQFLFGPAITGRLLKFFNNRIQPGEIKDNELLWKHFKEEVLTKEDFDKLIDDLVEIHFRVFEKARRETNRKFVMFGLDGISEISYDDVKQQLKESIDKIWNVEYEKMRQIVESSTTQVLEVNSYKKIDTYVDGSTMGLVVVGEIVATTGWCPPCFAIATGASIAVIVGWFIYQNFVIAETAEAQMSTAQQQFMKSMTETLKSLSDQTKAQFRSSSDIAMKRLFDAIREMIVTAYPQLSKENLQ
jgi:hypothetical protein